MAAILATPLLLVSCQNDAAVHGFGLQRDCSILMVDTGNPAPQPEGSGYLTIHDRVTADEIKGDPNIHEPFSYLDVFSCESDAHLSFRSEDPALAVELLDDWRQGERTLERLQSLVRSKPYAGKAVEVSGYERSQYVCGCRKHYGIKLR